MKIEEVIESNLKYIKNLVISDGDRKEDGELLWEFYRDTIGEMMKEYAREVLRDYDNWKAHKTPDLVEQYIKEKEL